MNGKLSVVIPCFNAEQNITDVVEKDIKIFCDTGIENYEFILVNDCSRDGTWSVLKALSQKYENVIAVNLAKNCGQHGAIMAGFHNVSGDYVIVSDDDGQTQMEMVETMFQKMDEGYDVVSTDWVQRGPRPLYRRVGTALGRMMNEVLMNNPKDIVVSIFFLAKRFVIDEIIKYQSPYPYIAGLVLRTTHNIGVVEVTQLPRQSGTSGYSFKKLLGLWMNGFTAFSVAPLRLAAYVGILSASIGFIYGIYIILRKLIINDLALGWSSTIAIMLFMFGIILCVLGLIGEYVGRIYMCINNTPQYIVKEILGTEGKTQ